LGLAAAQDESDPRYVYIWDEWRLNPEPQRLTILEFTWVQMFDGQRTLRDIQAAAMRQVGGQLLPLEWFANLLHRLDEALFLDSPRFQERTSGATREPSCIGCYPAEPDAIRRQLERLFTAPGSSGLPREKKPDGRLRAVLLPHIDYQARRRDLYLGLQGSVRA
jgi:hypothetical protein